MPKLYSEIRYALHSLSRLPAFSFTCILTLGLAIGAATSVFSVVNGVLLKPLAYPDSDRLVLVWETSTRMLAAMGVSEIPVSPAMAYEWKERNRTLSGSALFQSGMVNITGLDRPDRARGALVSPDLFPLLAVRPQLGRVFTEEDAIPGSAPVAILSHGLWQRRFGGRKGVVGTVVRLNDDPYTVVGVMPPAFAFPRGNEYPHADRIPETTEVWRPLMASPADRQNFGNHNTGFLGKLRQGHTLGQVHDDLAAIERAFWEQREPGMVKEFGVAPVNYLENMVKKSRPSLLLLCGAVALVMLIACVNVAGLLVVRTIGRRPELAVRAAMGAGATAIGRLVLIESSILALAGGVLGAVLGFWGLSIIRMLGGDRLPRLEQAQGDPAALAFSIAAAMAAAGIFAVTLSVLNARVQPAEALKEGSRSGSGRHQNRIRTVLAISEVAISMVLLTGSGLLGRSMFAVLTADRGFEMDRLLTMQIPLPGYRYRGTEARAALAADLLARVRNLPGVGDAAAVNQLPLTGESNIHAIRVEGLPTNPGEEPVAEVREVTPAYFSVFGLRMRIGREVEDRDIAAAPLVAVVNESLARRFWPSQDAVGKRFRLGERETLPWVTVVGIVADSRQASLEKEPRPQVFTPWAQRNSSTLSLAVRASGDPGALVSSIRETVSQLDRDLPLMQVRTMDEVLAASTELRQLQTVLLGVFALFALVLVATGLHGVIAWSVAQRGREFSVRVAFGAARRDLLRQVFGQGVTVALLGLLPGIVGSLALARFLGSFLYGVSAYDALTYVTAGGLVIAVALLATAQPAIRAARVNAVDVLREG